MNLIVELLLVSLAINGLLFIPAFIYKTDKLTDLSYSLSFAVLSIYGLLKSSLEPVHLLVAICVLLWALRLGTFLFIRIRKMNKDKRFDGMREHFFLFLRFWILQAVVVWVVMLSSASLFMSESASLQTLTMIGVAVFAVGLALESVADLQKYRFSQIKKNKNKWISSGLWSISRHPNYLGEMIVWIGVFIMSASVVSGWDLALSAISPLSIIMLLLFISGIPLLEKSADTRWGTVPAYKKYKSKTAVLIPFIW